MDTDEIKLSAFYDENNESNRVNLIKFLLMPFVFFALLGFPIAGAIAEYVTSISSFAALTFFVMCGFFTLVPDKKAREAKIKRALKRSWLWFALFVVVYFLLSLGYMAIIGSTKRFFSAEYFRAKKAFNFLVLNVWPFPVGSGVWFIHSLAYAYLLLFLIEKLNRPKIYLPLLTVLILFMLFSGEFAGVAGFPYFGYPYIPGGTFTKALPFMLIGMYLRKFVDKFDSLPRITFVVTFFFGIGIAVCERILLQSAGLLVYSGNAIGCAIMAISACLFAVTEPVIGESFIASHGRNYARRMYLYSEGVYLASLLICVVLDKNSLPVIRQFASVISFAVSFVLSFLVGKIKYEIAFNRGFIEI